MLSYADEDEKTQISVIDIEALRAISRIVRPIQERIDAGERTRPGPDTETCPAGDPRGSTIIY
jgi:hypothetical protein